MKEERVKMPNNGKLNNTIARTNKPMSFDCLLAMSKKESICSILVVKSIRYLSFGHYHSFFFTMTMTNVLLTNDFNDHKTVKIEIFNVVLIKKRKEAVQKPFLMFFDSLLKRKHNQIEIKTK